MWDSRLQTEKIAAVFATQPTAQVLSYLSCLPPAPRAKGLWAVAVTVLRDASFFEQLPRLAFASPVLSRQAHLGDLDGLARNEPMVDGVKYEPTKVRTSVE